MPASALPASGSNTFNLPSSTDAGSSDKEAAALTPSSLARSAEQAGAEDTLGASEGKIDEQIPKPEAAGRDQGSTFDPVRDPWH